MAEKIRVVHYLNQFFAQFGGEEKADIGPGFKDGPIGPGRALQGALGQEGEVVATCFCGDNYFAEHLEEATEELLRQMASFKPQLLIAGPAFESGRYGVACGAIGHAAQERLNIRAVAGMDAENAGTGLYRKKVYIVDSGSSVMRMAPVIQRMTGLGLKLVKGMPLGRPEEEGYFPRGIKRNAFAAKPPAERAVDMLLAKIRSEPFDSEIATPQFQHVKPAGAIRDLS
jgi:glycine reductase